MTYSIVALDSASGDLGVGVQTHQPAVGAIVPWISPGVGAVATQAMVNIDLGPRSLALLERGLDAGQALSAVLAADSGAAIRQLAIVDAAGNAAAHTGDETIPCAGHRTGSGYSVQANMMRNDTVPAAMADAFQAATDTSPSASSLPSTPPRLKAATCVAANPPPSSSDRPTAPTSTTPGTSASTTIPRRCASSANSSTFASPAGFSTSSRNRRTLPQTAIPSPPPRAGPRARPRRLCPGGSAAPVR